MRRSHLVSSQCCSLGSAAACADAQKKWSTCSPLGAAARGPVPAGPGGGGVSSPCWAPHTSQQVSHDMALHNFQTNPTLLPPYVQEESACVSKCVWGISSGENKPKGKSPVPPMERIQKAWIQQVFIKKSWDWLWIFKVHKTNFFSSSLMVWDFSICIFKLFWDLEGRNLSCSLSFLCLNRSSCSPDPWHWAAKEQSLPGTLPQAASPMQELSPWRCLAEKDQGNVFHSETLPDYWLHSPAEQLQKTLVTQKESKDTNEAQRGRPWHWWLGYLWLQEE